MQAQRQPGKPPPATPSRPLPSPAADPLHERTLAARTVFQGRVLRLEVLDILLPDGRRSTREIVRHGDAVAVLARLADGRFLFVRQYRKAIERAFLEVVAGALDPGEPPDVAAHRELREETGYRARRMLPLGATVACPGYSDERLHLFHAELESRPGDTAQDHDENIETVALPPAAVEQAIRGGAIEDAKTLVCWLLWKLKLEGRE